MLLKTKGQKLSPFRLPSMLMNPKDLSWASGLALDVDEKTWLMLIARRFSSASMDVYETPDG